MEDEENILENELKNNANLSTNSSTNVTQIISSFYFYEVEQFTVLWLLFIIIVAGNLGVMYTLIFGRCRKSRMNFFITHLAFADLSVGLISVLTDIIWKMTVTWYAGNVACKVIRFLQVVVTYASTYVLVALSIDRYDAIRHPMKFSGSWRRAKCLIITAWLCSVLNSTPILLFYEEKEIDNKVQCWIEFSAPWKWQLYMTLVSISLFIIPTAIIATCYAIIIATIWSKSAAAFSTARPKKNGNSSGIGRLVFILCWAPYILFDLMQVYGQVPVNQTNIAIATLIQSLAPLNSAANPIIYCIFSTHFCKTLCSLPPFKWICKKKKRGVESTTQSSSLSEFLTNNTNKKRMEDLSLGKYQQNSIDSSNLHSIRKKSRNNFYSEVSTSLC